MVKVGAPPVVGSPATPSTRTHTHTHNGRIVSGRRAAAVVLLQGYIPRAAPNAAAAAAAAASSSSSSYTARAFSLNRYATPRAGARVQSVGPIRKTSVVHPGAPLPAPPPPPHTQKHTLTHDSHWYERPSAAGKPVFDLYDSTRGDGRTRDDDVVGALAAAAAITRPRACVCQAPPKPPPRPSPVAPCHRQITRLVCSPRYRTRPS